MKRLARLTKSTRPIIEHLERRALMTITAGDLDTSFGVGGPGRDRMYGDAGNYKLEAGAGVDRLWGGLGNDLLAGGSGNDKLYGEAGDDSLAGGVGDDWVYGVASSDLVYSDRPTMNFLDEQTDLITLVEGFENIL